MRDENENKVVFSEKKVIYHITSRENSHKGQLLLVLIAIGCDWQQFRKVQKTLSTYKDDNNA